MTSSRSSWQGDSRIDPRQVTTPLAFTRYASQKLGCEVPVGGKARGVWYKRLLDEMEAQGWTWGDLLRAIDHVKDQKIKVRKIDGIFYYVNKSKRPVEASPIDAQVAQAIRLETDEGWKRRLSLATGKQLERVYSEWLRERSHAVRG